MDTTALIERLWPIFVAIGSGIVTATAWLLNLLRIREAAASAKHPKSLTHVMRSRAAQPSATRLLCERLNRFSAHVSAKVHSAADAELSVARFFSDREQVLVPVARHFRRLIYTAKKDPSASLPAVLLAGARRYLDSIDLCHSRLCSIGPRVFHYPDTGLVDSILLADFSTPVSKLLCRLADIYPTKAGAVEIYLIASDKHFLTAQDTVAWLNLFAAAPMRRFFTVKHTIPFAACPDAFKDLALTTPTKMLCLGAERIFDDGTVTLLPGMKVICDLARQQNWPVLVIAESYKVQECCLDDVRGLGSDSSGHRVELATLPIDRGISLLTDHGLHRGPVVSTSSRTGIRRIRSSVLSCCRRHWLTLLDGNVAPLAFVFDLDGTLIDSEDTHYELYRKAAQECHYELSRMEYESELRGLTDLDTMKSIVARAGAHGTDALKLAVQKQQEFLEYLTNGEIQEIKGAHVFLSKLRSLGFPIGVATSATLEEALAALSRLNMLDLVDVVVTGEAVEEGKPHPGLYLMAAAELHVEPAECVAYEDSPAGIRSAVAAGMKAVKVGKGGACVDLPIAVDLRDYCGHELTDLIPGELRTS